jgi:transposase
MVRRELKIVPAKAVVNEFWRYSYLCGICEKTTDGPAPIVKADLPPQVIKGSMCAPETVAHIIEEKCVMGSPLYRQEASWNRLGIQIKRQTMASWLIKCSEDYLEPIYDKLHSKLCQHMFLQSDSTSFQVLNEPGRPAQSQSQMWLYRTSGDAEHPIVLYDYQQDKRQERPRDFLAGFSGYLMTDGFQSYHCLPDNIIVVGCFAHVFTKFSDALKVLKTDEERTGSLALVGKQFCGKLFDIERDIKDKSFDERHAIRNEKAKPILDEFYAWLLSVQPHAASKNKIGVAINYALNQWKYLERYLLDGRIECNNNRSERSIKPFVINRKNFLFADSVAGARAAAVLHSMTETAKENHLNPHEYLSHIFRTAAGINLREHPDKVTALLPENVPESCKVLTSQ